MKRHAFSQRAWTALALMLAPACADVDVPELDPGEEEIGYSEAALGLSPRLGDLPVQINLEPPKAVFDIGPVKQLPVVLRKDGDFNADGFADIAWHHDQGETSMWLMKGKTFTPAALPPVNDKNWRLVGSGDFNQDRQADLVWRHALTGQISFWFMNGTTFLNYNGDHTVSAAEWDMQGVGDFNRDGRDDILWRRNSDGLLHVWLMNGTRVESTIDIDTTVADRAWQVGGIGDFDKDGDPDILWRYTRPGSEQGRNIIWRMDGHRYTGAYELPVVSDLAWQMRSAADYNSDGQTDIAWRNTTTGQVSLWFMKLTTVLQRAESSSPSLSWQMSGPQHTPAKAGQRANGLCEPGYYPVKEFDTELRKWLTDCVLTPISCPPGTAQDGVICASCGGQGEVACPGQGCDPGFAAYTGFCQPCGGEGQRSCGADARGCNGTMELHNNLCRTCGGLQQPVCVTREYCDPGLEAWHGACRVPVRRVPEPHEGCGGFKESCCTNPIYTRACTDTGHVCRPGGLLRNGSNVCLAPLPVNQDSPSSGGQTCAGTKASNTVDYYRVGLRDANLCGNTITFYANSESEAAGCAQAAAPGWSVLTSGNLASYTYAIYSPLSGQCNTTYVQAFSQSDANTCAQSVCTNCSVQQGSCP